MAGRTGRTIAASAPVSAAASVRIMSATEERRELWGGETKKAVENFPVSGHPIPVPVIRWLGRIKATAARVNADLGLLDQDLADRIAAAGDEIAEGKHDDQFPIDVFQTGSGTSSNMNANEVMANLAGEGVHPNDHVHMGQSSNDVFPSAVHLAALAERVRGRIKSDTGIAAAAPADPFEAQGNRDALVELSGALKTVAVSMTKIANDLALMGSGPRTGLTEIFLPELQKGSSIMPGKVNPVIPEVVLQVGNQVIGNDTAITIAGTQGNFELNVRLPLIARNLFDSIKLLTSAATLLAEKCVDGIEANEEVCRQHGESTPAIATALNPYIGYDRGTEIVQEAVKSRRTIREVAREKGVDDETLDKALDLRAMARPHE